ncbi:MAG: fused isobutyryl-CoA mutase/GTPase IcmF [Pseudomonadota bacterium]
MAHPSPGIKAAEKKTTEPYKPKNPLRFVTATSLFDGHDATANMIRRLLMASGAEVIHLGHSRSVQEVVEAALQEDVQGAAVTCYQGGHMEYFSYMKEMFDELGAPHIRIFGGGGGVIRPGEIDELHAKGVAGIYSPEDGRKMGLQGMINHVFERADFPTVCAEGEFADPKPDAERFLPGFTGMPLPGLDDVSPEKHVLIARLLSFAETAGDRWKALKPAVLEKAAGSRAAVIGITGTGGAGKSSLCDELVRRFTGGNPGMTIAVLAADPTKKATGGALLGDRIRMNAISGPRTYMRSFATRTAGVEFPPVMEDAVAVLKAAGFDLVLVETSGIGQRDSAVTGLADVSVYVMTSEYGASSQLEKIDMLDLADVIVLNKYERRGSEDAVREIRNHYRRSRSADYAMKPEDYPVFGTIASQFNDSGVNALYAHLMKLAGEKSGMELKVLIPEENMSVVTTSGRQFPPERVRYLGEIAETCRAYRERVKKDAELVSKAQAMEKVSKDVDGRDLKEKAAGLWGKVAENSKMALETWKTCEEAYTGDEMCYEVRGREFRVAMTGETLAGTKIPKVAIPRFRDRGDLLEYLMFENLPGSFPYTAGVFPFKRTDEDPKRQFAGEGPPEKTNKRFHYLCRGEKAKRLSTAFDSVTLYGNDPDERPDIYGKVGESGVSICTLDDMKKLYAGFDLCDPNTSVSMTINGPAPIMLAFFMNTAIDQQMDRFREQNKREPTDEEAAGIRADTLSTVRGTVQADILKEDQGQNTCIFSIDFALRMMGDVQQYFIDHNVRNFYSVSISGYHIAEAGANPITQLALTVANGFTYVEYYLSRGMDIDAFGPNLSFFFSNGMDAEYSVLGRVARRIWSVAMREKYGGNDRTQKLKYHIQTSGRSLHEQDAQFNDIRTTLQGLLAIYDNCNSLHTNSYDEAITTPTEESVRRAMAIQMIINREFGLTKNENPFQGSYAVEWLTDYVEEEVLKEFERLSERGGVLGAMELQYQRSKIQEESLLYEMKKHDGTMPIVGVNTYIDPRRLEPGYREPEFELRRSTPEEKKAQLDNLRAFQARGADRVDEALARLKKVATSGGNIFGELMETVRCASLGRIVTALYEVGGQYRRAM